MLNLYYELQGSGGFESLTYQFFFWAHNSGCISAPNWLNFWVFCRLSLKFPAFKRLYS